MPILESKSTLDMESNEVSALPGCYLLVILGEPLCDNHKEKILQRVAKGLLSWNTEVTQCDLKHLEEVCDNLKAKEQGPVETALLLQHSTDKLAVEVLFNPQIFALKQCLRNLLLSPTGHKHIIYAGYSFTGSGSWILQDGIFRFHDFVSELSDPNVAKVLSHYGCSLKMHLHCAPIGDWVINNLENQSFSHLINLSLNPPDSPNGVPGASNLLEFIENSLGTLGKEESLESSAVIGNIRFERPTMYIFPSGQGDCSLFGITGFTMLIDGGFTRFPCFWKFVRHIERLDSIMMTRINESNLWGILSLLRGKQESSMFLKIGYVFCNIVDKKANVPGDAEGKLEQGGMASIQSDPNDLIISIIDVGNEIASRLKQIGCNPHQCLRESTPSPLTLYHKVGHGTLEMYVLSPPRDSRLMKDFLSYWNSNRDSLPVVRTRSASKNGGKPGQDIAIPISDVMSICCLIIWKPADPSDRITRILFPGSAPQSQIMEGLSSLKELDLFSTRVCTRSSMEQQSKHKTVIKSSNKTTENVGLSSNRYRSVSPTIRKSRVTYAKQTSTDLTDKGGDSSESQSSPIKRKVNISLVQKSDNSSKRTPREPIKKKIAEDKKTDKSTTERKLKTRAESTSRTSVASKTGSKSSEITSESSNDKARPVTSRSIRARIPSKPTKSAEKIIDNTKGKTVDTDASDSANEKREIHADEDEHRDSGKGSEDASPRKLPYLDHLRDEVEPDSLESYDIYGNVEISKDSLEHSEDEVITGDSRSTSQLDQVVSREDDDDDEMKSRSSPIQPDLDLQSAMISSLSSNISEMTVISGEKNDDSASDLEVASLTSKINNNNQAARSIDEARRNDSTRTLQSEMQDIQSEDSKEIIESTSRKSSIVDQRKQSLHNQDETTDLETSIRSEESNTITSGDTDLTIGSRKGSIMEQQYSKGKRESTELHEYKSDEKLEDLKSDMIERKVSIVKTAESDVADDLSSTSEKTSEKVEIIGDSFQDETKAISGKKRDSMSSSNIEKTADTDVVSDIEPPEETNVTRSSSVSSEKIDVNVTRKDSKEETEAVTNSIIENRRKPSIDSKPSECQIQEESNDCKEIISESGQNESQIVSGKKRDSVISDRKEIVSGNDVANLELDEQSLKEDEKITLGKSSKAQESKICADASKSTSTRADSLAEASEEIKITQSSSLSSEKVDVNVSRKESITDLSEKTVLIGQITSATEAEIKSITDHQGKPSIDNKLAESIAEMKVTRSSSVSSEKIDVNVTRKDSKEETEAMTKSIIEHRRKPSIDSKPLVSIADEKQTSDTTSSIENTSAGTISESDLCQHDKLIETNVTISTKSPSTSDELSDSKMDTTCTNVIEKASDSMEEIDTANKVEESNKLSQLPDESTESYSISKPSKDPSNIKFEKVTEVGKVELVQDHNACDSGQYVQITFGLTEPEIGSKENQSPADRVINETQYKEKSSLVESKIDDRSTSTVTTESFDDVNVSVSMKDEISRETISKGLGELGKSESLSSETNTTLSSKFGASTSIEEETRYYLEDSDSLTQDGRAMTSMPEKPGANEGVQTFCVVVDEKGQVSETKNDESGKTSDPISNTTPKIQSDNGSEFIGRTEFKEELEVRELSTSSNKSSADEDQFKISSKLESNSTNKEMTFKSLEETTVSSVSSVGTPTVFVEQTMIDQKLIEESDSTIKTLISSPSNPPTETKANVEPQRLEDISRSSILYTQSLDSTELRFSADAESSIPEPISSVKTAVSSASNDKNSCDGDNKEDTLYHSELTKNGIEQTFMPSEQSQRTESKSVSELSASTNSDFEKLLSQDEKFKSTSSSQSSSKVNATQSPLSGQIFDKLSLKSVDVTGESANLGKPLVSSSNEPAVHHHDNKIITKLILPEVINEETVGKVAESEVDMNSDLPVKISNDDFIAKVETSPGSSVLATQFVSSVDMPSVHLRRSAQIAGQVLYEVPDEEDNVDSPLSEKKQIGLSHETTSSKEYPEVFHISEGVSPSSPSEMHSVEYAKNMNVDQIETTGIAGTSMVTTPPQDTKHSLCCFPRSVETDGAKKEKEESTEKSKFPDETSGAFQAQSLTEQQIKDKEVTLKEWGNPLGLPKPPASTDSQVNRSASKSRAKSSDRSGSSRSHSTRRSGSSTESLKPMYLDLAYIPHHGDRHYCNADYFKRVRARYYVLSGVNPSKEVLDALIEGKQSWEDKTTEVTLIPSHESEVLCLWMATNQKTLETLNIEVAPSASRCSVILQDQESSCSAYRVEF